MMAKIIFDEMTPEEYRQLAEEYSSNVDHSSRNLTHEGDKSILLSAANDFYYLLEYLIAKDIHNSHMLLTPKVELKHLIKVALELLKLKYSKGA